jgi:hypothetical protein
MLAFFCDKFLGYIASFDEHNNLPLVSALHRNVAFLLVTALAVVMQLVYRE